MENLDSKQLHPPKTDILFLSKIIVDTFAQSLASELTIPLTMSSEIRKSVYKYAESHGLYCKKIPYKKQYTIQLSKTPFLDIDVDGTFIRTFCRDTGFPFVSGEEKTFQNALRRLEPYYPGSTRLWGMFQKQIQEIGGISMWERYKFQVKNAVVKHFQEQKQLVDWKEHPVRALFVPNIRSLYKSANHGKWFLSIDVRSANFTTTKCMYPTLVTVESELSETWDTFLAHFTSSEFLRSIKPFRALVFGSTPFLTSQTDQWCYEILDRVLEFILPYERTRHLRLHCGSYDERVYIFETEEAKERIQCHNDVSSQIERLYPGMFHVELFQILCVGENRFVKEHQNGTAKFCKCGPQEVMKCMQQYETMQSAK